MLLLMLANAATAADTWVCSATFTGPQDECDLRGTWTVEGAGKSRHAAEDAAVRRLQDAVLASAVHFDLKADGTVAKATTAANLVTCPPLIAPKAALECNKLDPGPKERLCFADFPAPQCTEVELKTLEGVPWKLIETEHKALCDESEQYLRSLQAPPLTLAECRATCLQEARVRCK